MAAFNINRADYRDIEEIVKIESSIFAEKRSNTDFIKALSDERSIILTAKSDNKLIAYIWICGQDLMTIAVIRGFRRSGVAYRILNKALNNITEDIFLEVRESNIAAINLYEKCGFYRISLRKRYYSDGENAIVMVKKANELK